MKCPGQDSRYWKPGAIFETKCPKCGSEVEFFKDDSTRRCSSCGHKFLNPSLDFGCASYCQYAEQCIGNLPPELIGQKEDLLKDRVAIEMKRYFRNDFKRIGHASRVARYAERIGKQERANLAVVLTAAYLHDIGMREAERKHQGSPAPYHEEEGPAVAAEMLQRLGAKQELMDEVVEIIARHHHPRPEETVNFKCVYDADLIVNLEEDHKESPLKPEEWSRILEESFLTESGKKLAEEILISQK
jgi:putative nucleotidyltransferase with HDIG domain